jgi:hypothetical protein
LTIGPGITSEKVLAHAPQRRREDHGASFGALQASEFVHFALIDFAASRQPDYYWIVRGREAHDLYRGAVAAFREWL